jgi:hypothetical protein
MKLILVFLLLLASISAMAEESVSLFISLTPAGSFTAVSKKVKGNLIKEGGVFKADKITVSIESLKTGIDLRDEHTWKHMNSTKHPKATLSNLKAQGGKGTFDLEVNGVTVKGVTVSYTEKGNEVLATFKVSAKSFKLPEAKYLGVGVEDTVKVDATLPFKVR